MINLENCNPGMSDMEGRENRFSLTQGVYIWQTGQTCDPLSAIKDRWTEEV